MKTLLYVLQSMRPGQWTKNLVVFAALVFSQNVTHPDLILNSVYSFLIFCLLSGMIYVVNDIADIEKDKLHERKRTRPMPSGKLSKTTAWTYAVIGIVVGLFAAARIGEAFTIVSAAFLALNFLYSFVLKRVALLDVMSISVSFILRAIAGVAALQPIDPTVQISPWLLICTLFLSLFLAFCKRRHELVTMSNAGEHRESLLEYNPALLDQLVAITAGGSILSYAIYTIWPDTVSKFGTTDMMYTIPLVIIGVMRYLYLVYTKEKGGNPSDLLLHERFLLIVVSLWVLLVIAILTIF